MLTSVPYALDSVSLVRRRVVAGLTGRVPAPMIDDAALVMTELVANAVRHGLPLAGHALHVDWDVTRARLRLCVTDGGGGPAPRTLEVDVDSEGGRGLFLVDALAGSWGVQPSALGSTVWVEWPVGLPA